MTQQYDRQIGLPGGKHEQCQYDCDVISSSSRMIERTKRTSFELSATVLLGQRFLRYTVCDVGIYTSHWRHLAGTLDRYPLALGNDAADVLLVGVNDGVKCT